MGFGFASTRTGIVLSAAFLGAGALAVLVGVMQPELGGEVAVIALSLLSIAHGLGLFWIHGDRRITSAGVWGLSSAVFVGGGGLYGLVTDSDWRQTGLLLALSVAFVGQVLLYVLFWSRPLRRHSGRWRIDTGVSRWGIMLGSTTTLVSTLLAVQISTPNESGSGLEVLLSAGAFAGVVLLAASLLLGGANGLGPWRSAFAALGFFVYAAYLFSGFGRLNLAALGLCLAALACRRYTARTVKAILLVAAVPALIILALVSSSTDELSGGFISPLGPLGLFGRLLVMHQEGGFPLGWGSTFWAAAVGLVPRSLWAGKPIGFGAVLVQYLHPELVTTGHSDAALIQSEWLFNFGFPGLALMIPVVGLFVRNIDDWLARLNASPVNTRRRLLSLVAATILSTGVANLLWVGTFTYVIRTGASLVTVGLLTLVAGFSPLKRSEPRTPLRRRNSTPLPSRDGRNFVDA